MDTEEIEQNPSSTNESSGNIEDGKGRGKGGRGGGGGEEEGRRCSGALQERRRQSNREHDNKDNYEDDEKAAHALVLQVKKSSVKILHTTVQTFREPFWCSRAFFKFLLPSTMLVCL